MKMTETRPQQPSTRQNKTEQCQQCRRIRGHGLLPLLLLAALCAASLPQSQAKVTSLWVFGDDYVDIGNGLYMNNLARNCAVPPYGQNQGAPSGRCSNGKILTDQFASQMGLMIGPSAGPEEWKTNGVSFATAGAGALDVTNAGKTSSLSQQLEQFKTYVKQKGFATLNESIVIVSFGMHDYLQAILEGKDPMALVDRVVPSIINLIKTVQTLTGAYRFLVIGVPPLGCLPYIKQKFYAPWNKCVANLNAVNEFHEKRLDFFLDDLMDNKPLGSPTYYSKFSLTKAFTDKKLGFPAFTKSWEYACGLAGKNGEIFPCGQNVTWTEHGAEQSLKVEAKQVTGYDYFWWDWLSLTENAYYTIWVGMWLGGNSVRPMSVVELTFT